MDNSTNIDNNNDIYNISNNCIFEVITNKTKNLVSFSKVRKFRNLTNSKTLTRFKNSNLIKAKKSDFVKTNCLKIFFIMFNAKITFIYLQKIFIKASIFQYYYLKHYISIETDK